MSHLSRLIERVPEALAKFGVECLHLLHDALHLVALADFVVRAGFHGGHYFGEIGPKAQIGLVLMPLRLLVSSQWKPCLLHPRGMKWSSL